jgi:class 3 adenylate cyclase
VELQRAIAARNRGRPEREQIRMRIGLDMGQVVIDRNINYDVFGMRVNVAARVMDRADGGQILLTQSIHDAVVGWLSDVDFRLVAVGKARLKGVADPIQIYRVAYDEPVDADAPTTS